MFNKKTAAFAAVLLLCTMMGFTDEPARPQEGIRVFSVGVGAMYLPSFLPSFGGSTSVLPFYDNFSINGNIRNIIQEGPNLHLYFGLSHGISQQVLMPKEYKEFTSYDTLEQSIDTVYGNAVFSFLDFFNIQPRVDYIRNRLVTEDSNNSDYNFDKISVSGSLSFDTRYSSRETWFVGQAPQYPEKGFMLSVGGTYNTVTEIEGTSYNYWTLESKMQGLVQLHEFAVLSLEVDGKSFLEKNTHRANMISASVIGSYPVPGDYAVDSNIELRLLHKAGMFVETPRFGLASFLFKFSPGILVGYNNGFSGRIGETGLTMIHSGYISPLIEIRLNGGLMMVTRFDFAVSTSGLQNGVFSINFSTVGGTPGPLFKTFF